MVSRWMIINKVHQATSPVVCQQSRNSYIFSGCLFSLIGGIGGIALIPFLTSGVLRYYPGQCNLDDQQLFVAIVFAYEPILNII